MTSDRIVEVINLSKRFGKLKAVDNLTLNVYRGDVFGFLGPNGAGKSTTIRLLLSLIKPTHGTINIFGKKLEKHRLEILKNIGAIVEKPDFYGFMSAYKNLEILGRLSGKEISRRRIMDMLELVGLEKRYKSKVKTYSHGMKQRLGIAQALLHNPDLIILDEPTTGLDPQGMKEIRDLIIQLSKTENKTILLSSHLLSEVEQVANRMIIINKGSTVVEGNVSDLLNFKEFRVSFSVGNSERAKKIITESGWQKYFMSEENSKLLFTIKEEEIHLLNKFLVENDVAVNGIVPMRSLEEYFLSITQSEK